MELFGNKITLDLPKSDICYHPNFIHPHKANYYFEKLKNEVPWQQDDISVFGKTYTQPRLTALYANNDKPYSYSNVTMHPHLFNNELLEIKLAIEDLVNTQFTTCLLNLYRDGQDSNGWHADDEKELGKNPTIASITLGQERFFHLRNKEDRNLKHKLLLKHGSLLLMQGETQHYWQHQIAKTSKPIGSRINLTFRVIR
ncbi:alpha-ketoglutarate-dependent dioxygenase AlkB family protein [Croceitalea rosinachiae]|uniref:Alpha-ketoglutarate-dependent dioxygenase AlkB n=1 Tax=Croceitalea rosinachiae TaxID=3075596 RepID=A0ABU3A9P2_9FLAO|nr:alpha-ketoglutarate-dependent dioxygenase AlkB [Croceitalea sp. F388]MDT0606912.1 alpha-ketoglutarate-dependent dioxygenase AlkB [Croceitalea sp. F388]